MATNVNLTFRNCCQDFEGANVWYFDHTNQLLSKKTISNGALLVSYPVDTFIREVYTSYFDGIFFWSIEKVTNGVVIRRWYLGGNILRLDESFSFITYGMISYDSSAFAIDHISSTVSSEISSGDTILEVSSAADFSPGSEIYIGIDDVLGIYEYRTITSIDTDNDLIEVDRGLDRNYSIGKYVVSLNNIWLFNNHSPFDTEEASVIILNPDTGVLSSFWSSAFFRNVEAVSFSEGKIILLNGNSILFLNPSTKQIYKILYIDNLIEDRADTVDIYSIFIKSDLLYRLQTVRIYEDGSWTREVWSTYNFVTDSTISEVYFVEVFTEDEMIHKVSSPDVPTATTSVLVKVLTQYRVPVNGESVSVSSSKGYVSPSSGITDSEGEFSTTYHGTAFEGAVTITATA
jgi:hypothetical protein